MTFSNRVMASLAVLSLLAVPTMSNAASTHDVEGMEAQNVAWRLAVAVESGDLATVRRLYAGMDKNPIDLAGAVSQEREAEQELKKAFSPRFGEWPGGAVFCGGIRIGGHDVRQLIAGGAVQVNGAEASIHTKAEGATGTLVALHRTEDGWKVVEFPAAPVMVISVQARIERLKKVSNDVIRGVYKHAYEVDSALHSGTQIANE